MTSANPTSLDTQTPRHTRSLATVLSASFRGTRVALHIFYGMLLCSIYPLLNKPTQEHIVKRWSRALLDVLHVGLETHGSYLPATTRGIMLVANHISWLDAVALNAVAPARFVAKSEVGDWLLLGWIFHRINTLFIQRDIRRDTARVNKLVAALLERGERIALFPEGTTTDGSQTGHFHSSLLQGPVDIKVSICPVAIRYHNGTGMANNDAVFVGDMTFVQSLWTILCSPSLHITLVYLPLLSSADKNRRMLATEAQTIIHKALVDISSGHPCYTPDSSLSRTWHDAFLPIKPAYGLLLSPIINRENQPHK